MLWLVACVVVPVSAAIRAKADCALAPKARLLVAKEPGVSAFVDSNCTVRAFYGPSMAAGSTPPEATRAWIAAHADAFGVEGLELEELRTNAVGRSGLTVFAYRQRMAGLPVEGSLARIVVANGPPSRVVYAAAAGLAPAVGSFADELIDASMALAIVQGLEGNRYLDRWGVAGQVVFHGGNGAPPSRVWKITGSSSSRAESYTFFLSAASGQLLHVRNEVQYATVTGIVEAKVTPGILPDTSYNPPTLRVPLTSARVQLEAGANCGPLDCGPTGADDWDVTDSTGYYEVDGTGQISLRTDLESPEGCSSAEGPWAHVVNCASP
jgi:hypothetical protein